MMRDFVGWFVELVLAHPVPVLAAWGIVAAIGAASKATKRTGITLAGTLVVLAAIGWLWRRRGDVGRGVVVCVVGGCALAWALAMWKAPDMRWRLMAPATAVVLLAVGLPRWGWLDSNVGDGSILGWLNARLEGSYNRRAIEATSTAPTVGKGRQVPSGWEYHALVNGDPGAKLDPHEIGARVNRGQSTARQVIVEPHPELGRATVTISSEPAPPDLTAWQQIERVGVVAWPGPSTLDPTGRVVVGFDVHGRPQSIPGTDPGRLEHVAVAGATRRGKSATLAVIAAEHAFRPHTAIVMLDPLMVEFRPWAPRATVVVSGVEACRRMLVDLLAFVQARAERVDALGRRTAPIGPGWPAVIVFCDEVAAIADERGLTTEEKALARAAIAALTKISEQAAKFRVQLVLATQRPEVGVFEGRLRDNLLTRIAHRHSSGEASRMTAPGGPDLTSIPKSLQGAWLMLADDDWVPGRGLLLTPRGPVPAAEKDEALAYAAAEVAAATAHLRIPWEQL